MTAPAEDPRVWECQQSDWCGPGSHCLCPPAAGRGDTDSSDRPVANGHRWPCTRFYVTASLNDRCTCRPAGDRAQPTEEVLDDQLYLDGIRTENGEMVIDLHDAGQTLAHMALAMRTFWEGNASEGTNYVQTGVVHQGKTWNFVVYPAGKPTPHDLRRKAEAERDEALAALLDAQAKVERVEALADEFDANLNWREWGIGNRIRHAIRDQS